MYVLIDHSGSPDHINQAKKMAEYLQDEWGLTVDFSVSGSENNLSLYNENMEKITEFKTYPNNDLIDFYIKHYLIDNEDLL